MALLDANKGRPMQGIVEQARDGSTLRVYLLPEFQFVQVFVAGIQVNMMPLDCLHVNFLFNFFFYAFQDQYCLMSIFLIFPVSIKAPAVARRPAAIVDTDTEETNGDVSAAEAVAPLNSAQRLAASTASAGQQSTDEPFALDAKYFTEMRVLNREVCAFLIKLSSLYPHCLDGLNS